MSAPVPAGRARAQVAWILLLLTCAALSILWWRADLAACTCDACPDGHCGYAERIHLALTGSLPWTNLHQFARWYMHAQIPLSASLVAIAMFAVSAFVKSQAATLTIMIPFGLALGLPTHLLLGVMPSSYAYFFFAFYPSDLAAISMDRTGTTRIGKYLLNHSFMVPGLIGVGVSTCVAYLLSRLFF